MHDRGMVIADLALSLALGGICLADIALLRSQPDLVGHVVSDPTVSRLIDRLPAVCPCASKGLTATCRGLQLAHNQLASTRTGGAP
ncbi:hypothetical protein ACIA8R_21240 [Nonomuraea sp. NPDC051191]|uniref:hypothetical protein n=1 Tax=Nonomuraea sp. NPDC051191 TaxID=3364372 RepID=UPI0037945B0A